jgi:hypothetical protein
MRLSSFIVFSASLASISLAQFQVPVPWLVTDLSISNVRHGTGGLYVLLSPLSTFNIQMTPLCPLTLVSRFPNPIFTVYTHFHRTLQRKTIPDDILAGLSISSTHQPQPRKASTQLVLTKAIPISSRSMTHPMMRRVWIRV